MLHVGAGNSNNCQIILKLFGYDIFCNILQHKKNKANLEVSAVLITYIANREKTRVMLRIARLSKTDDDVTIFPVKLA